MHSCFSYFSISIKELQKTQRLDQGLNPDHLLSCQTKERKEMIARNANIITARVAKREKVMSSQAFVCPCQGGRTTPMHHGIDHMVGGEVGVDNTSLPTWTTPLSPLDNTSPFSGHNTLPPRTTPPSPPPAQVTTPLPLANTSPPGQVTTPPPSTMRKRTVRVLLECFLVLLVIREEPDWISDL